MSDEITIGSLFSGIGGLELGLERGLGNARTVWQVESDSFCRSVLARHWPDAERFDDVCSVGSETLAPVDLVCGGFPCQDISAAGTRTGLDGPRSGLWHEYARIIRELRPRFVVVENVPPIIRNGLDRVLGALASLGYDAIWDCIPASAVGATHRRDRFFLLAWRVSDADGGELRHGAERGQGAAQATVGGDAEPRDVGQEMADSGRSRRRLCVRTLADSDRWRCEAERIASRERRHESSSGDRHHLPKWPPGSDDVHAWRRLPNEAQPAVCRIAHGVPAGVDRRRLRALGNAVVPDVAEIIGSVLRRALTPPDGSTIVGPAGHG